MTLKQLHAPHLGRNVKMGRRRPAKSRMRLHLRDFLRLDRLPTIPESCDYSSFAPAVLADIMGNDQLGDCVIAAGYHVIGVESGGSGALFHASLEQVIRDYSAIGGYVPGDESTDQGCVETDAFTYWQEHGFADGKALLAWLSIDATNKAEVMAALFLFENLFFGVELPDKWVSPFPGPDFTWDVAGKPDPENGHAFMASGFDSSGVSIDTWGLRGRITWAALAKYASKMGQGELYVLLTPEQVDKAMQKAPNGLSWAALIEAFDELGGQVPVPPEPPPTPPAPPTPPTPPTPPAPPAPPAAGPTRHEVQGWLYEEFKHHRGVLNRSTIDRVIHLTLKRHWPE